MVDAARGRVAPGQDDMLAAHLVDRADMGAVRADHLHMLAHLVRHAVVAGCEQAAPRSASLRLNLEILGIAVDRAVGGERRGLGGMVGLGGLVAPAGAEAVIALPLGLAFLGHDAAPSPAIRPQEEKRAPGERVASRGRRRYLGRPERRGAVAQMGERCNRTAEVRGSIPLSSTSPFRGFRNKGNVILTKVRTHEHGSGTFARSVFMDPGSSPG